MKIENIGMILMVLGVLLLLVSMASFIVLLLICIKLSKIKNNCISAISQKNYQSERMETSVQQGIYNVNARTAGNQTAGNQTAGNQMTGNQLPQEGLVICRNCYQAVLQNSSTCPCCSAAMDRR